MSLNLIKKIAKVVIGILITFFLIWQIDFHRLGVTMHWDRWQYLGWGVLLSLFGLIVLQGIRFHLVIKKFTGSLSSTFKIFFFGLFFNSFLIGNTGGDLYKYYILDKKNPNNRAQLATLILLERLVNLFVFVTVPLIYLLFNHQQLLRLLETSRFTMGPRFENAILIMVPVLVIPLFASMVFCQYHMDKIRLVAAKISGFLRDCKQTIREMSLGTFAAILLLSVVFLGVRLVGFYLFTLYFGQTISFPDLVFAVCLGGIVAVIPISIGGLGTTEGAITGMLMVFGVDKNSAIAVAFINRTLLLFMSLLGGSIYLYFKMRKDDCFASSAPKIIENRMD